MECASLGTKKKLIFSILCVFFLLPVSRFTTAEEIDYGGENTVFSYNKRVYNKSTQKTEDNTPYILAQSAVLIELKTGAVLYKKNEHKSIPPASLTKLMTLHLIYNAIEKGKISRDDVVPISNQAWAINQPRGSSLMFIEPGQRVTVLELMKGLAVSSGNDAAVALAEFHSGSVSAFVEKMNQTAKDLNLSSLSFTDPAGIKSSNSITAYDFAQFCRIYLNAHPHSLNEIHSLKFFTHPDKDNYTNGKSYTPIVQENKNPLIGMNPTIDGLKTGYIPSSGYNISVTSKRNGMRLITVILGIPGKNKTIGNKGRIHDSIALMEYGFGNFHLVKPEIPWDFPKSIIHPTGIKAVLEVRKIPYVVLPKTVNNFSEYTLKLLSAGFPRPRINSRIGSIYCVFNKKVFYKIPVYCRDVIIPKTPSSLFSFIKDGFKHHTNP